jgi:hypothetical protein
MQIFHSSAVGDGDGDGGITDWVRSSIIFNAR